MAVEEYKKLEHVLVRFKDDPELLHQRWVIRSCGDGRYWVVTPVRDIWCTRLRLGRTYEQIVRFSGIRLPSHVRRREVLPRQGQR